MSSDRWTFLSNHGHVLVSLARDPGARTRDVAEAVGITERAVQQIVHDLAEQGYLERVKVGRRNHYTVVTDAHLRHPQDADVTVGRLLDSMLAPALPPTRAPSAGHDRAVG